MEMIELIHQYYQSERNTAYLAAAIGMVFFAASFILFQYFGNDRLIKGLSYAFFGASLFFITAGVPVAIHNKRKMMEVKLSPQTNMELHQSEIERMGLVITTGYRFALILFSTLVICGLAIILISPNDLWKGVGLGLLIIGTTGHSIETFSMKKNKAYQQKIEPINFKKI